MSGSLVDTNILVYCYDPADAAKQEGARAVLRWLVIHGLAVVSVQCLTELFRTVRWRLPKPLTPDEALRQVTSIAEACRVVDLTTAVVLEGCRASNRYQMSLWDALIWAAAKLNRVPYILTEDAEHGRTLEGVRYLNPFHSAFDMALLEVGA